MKNKEIYTDGAFKGLPIKDSDTWLADIFLEKANNDKVSRKARKQTEFVEYFAEELEGEDSVAWVEEISKELVNKRAYRPPVIVPERDMAKLSKALEDFLIATYSKKDFFSYVKTKYEQDAAKSNPGEYFLHWLVKNLTNSDSEDVVSYVKRYTDFTLDRTFANLNAPAFLFNYDDISFYCVNAAEYEAGLETPYLMLFWAEANDQSFMLPFIRYGIEETENGKTAYIYAVQRREFPKSEDEKRADKMFSRANASIKENRNASPSMIHMLACFMGMLHAKGIEKVKAPDFIIRRWGDFWDSKDAETDDRIQFSATNRFLMNLVRLDQQFTGIDVEYVPNDIDSFLHLKLDKNISTTYPTLEAFFESGKDAALTHNELISIKNPNLPKSLQVPDALEK
ncbi:MAG: hypothetical protein IKC11_03605 [Clostridia bacterium]|nr:hypothetical protein [Clostridia bacterium]